MTRRFLAITALCLTLGLSQPAFAVSPQPGNTCTSGQTGQYATNSGTLQIPGLFLVCDGSHWNLFESFTTDGLVGIGTAAPSAVEHIYASSTSSSGIRVEEQTSYPFGIEFLNDAYSTNWANAVGMFQSGAGQFEIYNPANGSNPALTILNGGNVGIGSTSPVASLDVSQKTDALALPSGTTAQRPSTPTNGMIRYNSTTGGAEGYVNGKWTSLGPSLWSALTPPIDANFSWVNQSTATKTVSASSIFMQAAAVSGDSLNMRVMNAPATPYTITAALLPALYAVNSNNCGILFRESSTGKVITLEWGYQNAQGGLITAIVNYNSATSWNSTPAVLNPLSTPPLVWLQIHYDGTTMSFNWSGDGSNFVSIGTMSNTAFFSSGPNQVGWYVDSANSSAAAACTLYSWN